MFAAYQRHGRRRRPVMSSTLSNPLARIMQQNRLRPFDLSRTGDARGIARYGHDMPSQDDIIARIECFNDSSFIAPYNFGRRLKTLKGLTPYEFICKQ